MSFTSLRNQMNNLDKINSTQDYVKKYLSEDTRKDIDGLENRFLEHLYGDIADIVISKDIKSYLGNGRYNSSNELAKECVLAVLRSRDIFGWRIKSWLDTALKSFDNILLVLIQEVLKENIKTYHGIGEERHKYQHLIDKGGDFAVIGSGFNTAYAQRNDVTHIEIMEGGQRRQVNLSNKQLSEKKEIALESLKKALNALYLKI